MRCPSHGPRDHHLEPAQPAGRPPGHVPPGRGRPVLRVPPQRRGLSGPDAAAGRGDHPEPGRQPRGDRAVDHDPARDRPQRDAGTRPPAQHDAGRAQRHQVRLHLRHRLLEGAAGGDQSDRDDHQPAPGRDPEPLALEPHGRDRPLCTGGPGVHPQRAQGGAGLGARAAAPDRARRDRCVRLRRHRQAVPGARRPLATDPLQHHPPAAPGRDLPVERQHRRRHPHPGEPVAQRARDRPVGQGHRPPRPAERASPRRARRPEARGHPQRRHHPVQGDPHPRQPRRQGGGRAPAAARVRGARRGGPDG